MSYHRMSALPIRSSACSAGSCCILLLFVSGGCASSGVAQQPREITTGPWDVSMQGTAPYGTRFSVGPFQTSEIGVLQSLAARREPKPETETVQFINDKVSLAFEIKHVNGLTATVRTGVEDTGQFVQVGFLKARKKDTVAGSVCMYGQVVGQFSIRNQKRATWGQANSEHVAGIDEGTVTTSAGIITVIHRFQPPPPPKSLVAAVMQPADEPVEEYRLCDRIVASRRGLKTTTVSIEPDLPLDVQFCIAAAMMIPMNQQANEDAAASASMLNTSAARLAL